MGLMVWRTNLASSPRLLKRGEKSMQMIKKLVNCMLRTEKTANFFMT